MVLRCQQQQVVVTSPYPLVVQHLLVVNHEWIEKEKYAPSETNQGHQQSPGLGDSFVVEVAQKEEERVDWSLLALNSVSGSL